MAGVWYKQENEAGLAMDYERKAVSFEIKREPDADGTFEGYASVFDVVDNGMDVVAPGAFGKSLSMGRRIKMLWQHDPGRPIGVWDEVREDNRGLFVKGRLLKDSTDGANALALLRGGAIDGMSIGYITKAATEEAGGRVRKLLEIDLKEVSLVTFPMLADAVVTDVKAMTTERDFERFLREAGFSRKEATAIALYGFKGMQRDAVAEKDGFEAVAKQLRQLQETLSNVGNATR